MNSKRRAPVPTTVQQASPLGRAEGFPLSLLKLPEEFSRSSEVTAFGVNMSNAPIPERRYAADVCSVSFSVEGARIVFAQEGLANGEIDSALVIKFNPHAVVHFAESLREIKDPTLAEIAGKVGVAAIPLTDGVVNPSQMAKMIANIAAVAVSGFETCIDFYHASAFAMRRVITGGSLEVEPIVRVDMSTGLFMSLADAIEQGIKANGYRSA